MSVLNLIAEFAAGNFLYIIQLVTENWFWVFGFAAASIYMRGKGLLGLAIVTLYVYANVDLAVMMGWDFVFVPSMFFVCLTVLGTLTDDFKFAGKYAIHAATFLFVVFMILHNNLGVF